MQRPRVTLGSDRPRPTDLGRLFYEVSATVVGGSLLLVAFVGVADIVAGDWPSCHGARWECAVVAMGACAGDVMRLEPDGWSEEACHQCLLLIVRLLLTSTCLTPSPALDLSLG